MCTSSSAVWNEMIHEIAARIDPENGLESLRLTFTGRRSDELDWTVFYNLIPLASKLHTLVICNTRSLPEEARYTVLSLLQSLVELQQGSLKTLQL